MKKIDIATPEARANFDAAMERIQIVTGCRTQVQLAEVLDVRQSSISDAKRRASIPSDWLLKLMRQYQLNPDWILTGEGAEHVGEILPAKMAALSRAANEALLMLQDMREQLSTAVLLAGMTNEDLTAHKAKAVQQLTQSLQEVQDMAAKIQTARAEAGLEA